MRLFVIHLLTLYRLIHPPSVNSLVADDPKMLSDLGVPGSPPPNLGDWPGIFQIPCQPGAVPLPAFLWRNHSLNCLLAATAWD